MSNTESPKSLARVSPGPSNIWMKVGSRTLRSIRVWSAAGNPRTGSAFYHLTISDEIAAWMDSGNATPAEFIIQANLPGRSVALRKSPTRTVQFDSVSGNSGQRQVRLLALAAAVRDVILAEPLVLKAAGALVISALPQQLRRVSHLPGIRDIRFNRKLR